MLEQGQTGPQIAVGDPLEGLARRNRRRDRGQALAGVAGVLLEMQADHGLDDRPLVGLEIAVRGQVIGQRAVLLKRPCLEGGDELGLVDHPVLEGDQAEQQIAVGVGHGRAPVCAHRSDRPLPSSGNGLHRLDRDLGYRMRARPKSSRSARRFDRESEGTVTCPRGSRRSV